MKVYIISARAAFMLLVLALALLQFSISVWGIRDYSERNAECKCMYFGKSTG